jgi:hypothetical protein
LIKESSFDHAAFYLARKYISNENKRGFRNTYWEEEDDK